MADSESFCAGKLIQAMLHAGVDVSVLYCSNINGTPHPLDRSGLWTSLKGIAVDVVLPTHKERLRSAILGARYRTYFYTRWLDAVVAEAKKLHARRPFDVVYSRSFPTIAHCAGFWCARVLNLPWVVNINDPWDIFLFPEKTRPRVSRLYKAVSSHWFRKTLYAADAITYPAARLQRYHERLIRTTKKADIIPHIGYSLSDPGAAHRDPLTSFHLLHAGKLGCTDLTCRPSISLLTGLAKFLEECPEARPLTQLTLVGREDASTQASIAGLGLGSVVRSTGCVDYQESLRQISSASVCVLVEADLEEGIFLPSKLADYVSARKPILALSPRIGTVADLAHCGGIVRVGQGNSDAIKTALTSFYLDFRRGTLNVRAPSDDLARIFDRRKIAGQFLQILEKACSTKSPAVLKDSQSRTPASAEWKFSS